MAKFCKNFDPQPLLSHCSSLCHNEIVTELVFQVEQPKSFLVLFPFQISTPSLPQIHKLEAENITKSQVLKMHQEPD